MINNNYYQDYSGGFNNNYPPPVPPPPPSPNYYQQGQTPQNNSSASSSAIISLVFGILSYILCPFFFGIAAWIMGSIESGKIKRGESPQAGKGFATAGMWLGIVNVILCVLGIIFYVVLVLFFIAAGTTHTYS